MKLQFSVIGLLVGVAVVHAVEEAKTAKGAATESKKGKRGLFDLGYGHSDSFNEHQLGHLDSQGIDFHGLDQGIGHNLGHQFQQQQPITVTKEVPVPVPHPVPYPVIKRVPYPVKVSVPVPVDRPYPVHVPQPYPVPVIKHVPIPIEKPYPYPVKVPVKVPVPHPVPVPFAKPVPYPVHQHVPYPVKVPFIVEKQVPYPIGQHGQDHHAFPEQAGLGHFGHGLDHHF